MATRRQPSRDRAPHSEKADERAISAPTADDALRVLVRMLARQAARDWLAGSPHPADQTQYEEVIHDQA